MSESHVQRWRRRALNEAIQRSTAWVRSTGAIAPGTVASEKFGSFGDGSIIAYPQGAIYGHRQIHIGTDTMVGVDVTMATGYGPTQTTVPPRALVIGDRTVIGTRSGLVAHQSIEIGDDVWFGQEIYVTDSNHGFEDLTTPIGRQLGAHQPVRIGSGTWIGHGAVVLPGSQIGRHVVVAAGSVVRGVIPDNSVIGGVPARIIRSYVEGEGWVRRRAEGSEAPVGSIER